MSAIALQTLQLGALSMHVASQGRGPSIILCHGFPELCISWRSQLQALADAGFRAVVPDMRGYGGTDSKAQIAQTLPGLRGGHILEGAGHSSKPTPGSAPAP